MGNDLIAFDRASDTIEVNVSRRKRHIVTLTDTKVVKTFFGQGRRYKAVADYEQEAEISRGKKAPRFGKTHRRSIQVMLNDAQVDAYHAIVDAAEAKEREFADHNSKLPAGQFVAGLDVIRAQAEQSKNAFVKSVARPAIKQRINGNAKVMNISKAVSYGLVAAALFGRAGIVMLEKGNANAAISAITTPLPYPEVTEVSGDSARNFRTNIAAFAESVRRAGDAIGIDEASADAALTVRSLSQLAYNAQPFGHANSRRAISGETSILGWRGADNLVLQQAAAAIGNHTDWVPAFTGEDPYVTAYRTLYMSQLATRQADDSVVYHADLPRLGSLAEEARSYATPETAGYDPAILLAVSRVLYESTGPVACGQPTDCEGGFSTEANVERRLTELGVNYRQAALERQAAYYSPTNDPNLAVIDAAQKLFAVLAREQAGWNREGELSATNDRIFSIARQLIELASRPDHGQSAETDFNQTVIDTSYARLAADDAAFARFLGQDTIQLSGRPLQVIRDVIGTDQTARVSLIRLYAEGEDGVRPNLYAARAHYGVRQPLPDNINDLVELAGSTLAGERDALAHTVAREGATTMVRSLLRLQNFRSISADTTVSNTGEAIFAALLASAPNRGDLIALARANTGEVTSAALLTVLKENPARSEAELVEAMRAELIEVGANLLLDDTGSQIGMAVARGAHYGETADELAANFSRTVRQVWDACHPADTDSPAGQLFTRLNSLYGIDADTCAGMLIYLAAFEGQGSRFNPSMLQLTGFDAVRRDAQGCPSNLAIPQARFNPACLSGPVHGEYHIVPDTAGMGLAYLYIPTIMDGQAGTRFVDRFFGNFQALAGGHIIDVRRGNGDLSQDELTAIIFEAAFMPGATYNFNPLNNSLTIKEPSSAQPTIYDLSDEAAVMAFTGVVREKINDRFGREFPNGNGLRQGFFDVFEHMFDGGTVRNLPTNMRFVAPGSPEVRETPRSLAMLVALTYTDQAPLITLGTFVGMYDEIRSVVGFTDREVGELTLAERRAGLLRLGHVRGGPRTRDAFLAGAWDADSLAARANRSISDTSPFQEMVGMAGETRQTRIAIQALAQLEDELGGDFKREVFTAAFARILGEAPRQTGSPRIPAELRLQREAAAAAPH